LSQRLFATQAHSSAWSDGPEKATDWQAHSVRGFLSSAAKEHGLKIESTKTEAGNRVHQIKK
jgi:hypothetical protein